MRKRITGVFAASAAAMLMLAGCGGGSGFSDDGNASAEGGLTNDSSQELTVLIGSSGDAETAAVEKAVAAWSEETGQKATVSVASDMAQQLSQGFAGGDPADVFYLAPEQLAGFASNGSLLAYGDELENKGDFYENLLQTFTYDGKLYAAPKDVSTLQLFINTDMWAEAGLTEADIPTTWDQLLEVAKKLTKSDGTQYGIALPDLGWGSFLKGNGSGVYTVDGEVSINTPENKAFLEKMRDFYKGGYTVAGMDETAARESFESGQSAMVIVGPWEDQAATDKGIAHDLFPVPAGDGTYVYPDGTSGSNTGSTGLYWWVTSQVGDSEKLPGIYEFFKFYNNHDNQVTWSLGSAYPPNNTTVTEEELSERPLIAKIAQYTDQSFIAVAGLKGGFGDIIATIDTLTSNTTRTDDDIQTMLDEAETKIQGYLDEYAE